jgi:riboflavin biosynthesis pyrimidine reductase/predicted DsbA family dithiol-disulfide isomerase
MALTIPVAHDFICPWCWVGLFQAKRLQQEFGARIDWRGYELYPADLYWPDYPTPAPQPANKPATPSRLDFLLAAEAISLPPVERPKKMRTYNAHQAVEYAKTEGVEEELIERLYRAFWEEGRVINDLQVIKDLAGGLVKDLAALEAAVVQKKFKKNIVEFDDEAYSKGVYNVPTFFIGGQRLAEQPYTVLREAVKKAQEEHGGIDAYSNLEFPTAPKDRPYVFVNMVTTIDGKILSGGRNENVSDLGSKVDHRLMKRIEAAADAVLVGAETLRATSRKWNPQAPKRIVVTRSGHVPFESAFLSEGEAYIATTGSANVAAHGKRLIRAGGQHLDFGILLNRLRSMGVQKLLVMGGSELNAQLLRADLVDELFITIAPKVKLGRDVPTYADGEALPRQCIQQYSVVEQHLIGNEIFVRYRREEND